jgi:prepilin-type N-terminal cleavage/methylation domain-containing protein
MKSQISKFNKNLPRGAQRSGGFTLVEMIVAVGLFAVIAMFSMGAVVSIYDANRRSESTKTVVDNLNLSLEDMVRSVRFGHTYHCGGAPYSSVQNCPNGDTTLAVNFQGNTVVYRLNGTAIQRSSDGGVNFYDITSPDTVVQYLKFYTFGTAASPDTGQPYVIAVIKGYVGNKPTTQSSFSIQTLMSQRTLDI